MYKSQSQSENINQYNMLANQKFCNEMVLDNQISELINSISKCKSEAEKEKIINNASVREIDQLRNLANQDYSNSEVEFVDEILRTLSFQQRSTSSLTIGFHVARDRIEPILKKMEKDGLIELRQDGRYSRWFLKGAHVREVKDEIFDLLRSKGGKTSIEIAEELHHSVKIVKEICRELESEKRIGQIQIGRSFKWIVINARPTEIKNDDTDLLKEDKEESVQGVVTRGKKWVFRSISPREVQNLILGLLREEGEKSVNELSVRCNVSRKRVLIECENLKKNGLIENTGNGQYPKWVLKDEPITGVQERILEILISEGGKTAQELANIIGVKKTKMLKILGSIKDKKVERVEKKGSRWVISKQAED